LKFPFYTGRTIFLLAIMVVISACRRELSIDAPPNILLIVSDDQRYDSMPYMPRTMARIFDEGINFEHAYVTTSRCCPSRASILTGMYAHNHQVILNSDPLNQSTFVEKLAEAGYFTGLVGKYLNSYPVTPADPPRPEFDYWIGMISGPNNARYFDTELNVNGIWQAHEGYQTFILRDYALEFLEQAAGQEAPFFLLFAPYAPHLPAIPAPGDEALYTDESLPLPPNFNPVDMNGKPAWLRALPLLEPDQIESTQRDRLHQLQTLNAFDAAIEDLLNKLESQDELENTVVIYLSDNGLFLGEHRLPIGKIYVYEESMHVPLAIRYPDLIKEPRTETNIVGNIDLAPTILELAGLEPPENMDGRSLVPLMRERNVTEWREALLLEGWPINVAYVGNSPPFQAMHTGRYVYVETEGDLPELYDLESDPFQLTNEISNPAYGDILATLQQALAAERESILPIPPR